MKNISYFFKWNEGMLIQFFERKFSRRDIAHVSK